MDLVSQYPIAEKIVIIAGPLSLMAILIWFSAHRRQFSPWAWVWFGACLLLIAINMQYSLLVNLDNFYLKYYLANISPNDFYYYSGFLLLILLGTLLTRRHGRLAILLPLGYLLPTILYERIEPPLFWISVIVLVYRLLIALVAPILIVRSASDRAIKQASTIVVLTVIGIQVAMDAIVINPWRGLGQLYGYLSSDLISFAGFVLALSLYKSIVPKRPQSNYDLPKP
jgi:hypothetical protein